MKRSYRSLVSVLILSIASISLAGMAVAEVNCPAGFVCTPVSKNLKTSTAEPISTVGNTDCFYFSINLQLGDSGVDVTELQKRLISKGYDIKAVSSGRTPYGYFGTQTVNALKKYQSDIKVSESGYLGPLTRSVLNAECPIKSENITVTIPSAGSVFDNGRDQNIIVGWNQYFGDFDSYYIRLGNQSLNQAVTIAKEVNKSSTGFSISSGQLQDIMMQNFGIITTDGNYFVVQAVKTDGSIVASGKSGTWSLVIQTNVTKSVKVQYPNGGEVYPSNFNQTSNLNQIQIKVEVANMQGTGDLKLYWSASSDAITASTNNYPIGGATGVDNTALNPYVYSATRSYSELAPGNYYLYATWYPYNWGVNTVDRSDSYFTIAPQTLEAKPVVTLVGNPTITKSVISSDELGNTKVGYWGTFNINVAAQNGDIWLGLPGNINPAFSPNEKFISVLKNGAVDTTTIYNNLSVYWSAPVGTTLSSDGMAFKIPAGQSYTFPVTVMNVVANPGANTYGFTLNGLGWMPPVLTYQYLPLSGFKTVSIASMSPLNLTASVWGAIEAYFRKNSR